MKENASVFDHGEGQAVSRAAHGLVCTPFRKLCNSADHGTESCSRSHRHAPADNGFCCVGHRVFLSACRRDYSKQFQRTSEAGSRTMRCRTCVDTSESARPRCEEKTKLDGRRQGFHRGKLPRIQTACDEQSTASTHFLPADQLSTKSVQQDLLSFVTNKKPPSRVVGSRREDGLPAVGAKMFCGFSNDSDNVEMISQVIG